MITDWAGGADGAPPGDSGRILTYFGATPTTVGPTTTNTVAPGDVAPELTTSFVKKRASSTIECDWWARVSCSVSSGKVHMTLVVDGVEYTNPRGRTGLESSSANDQGTPAGFVDITGLAAGTYTIAIYFWTTAGTATLQGVDRGLRLKEIVMPS